MVRWALAIAMLLLAGCSAADSEGGSQAEPGPGPQADPMQVEAQAAPPAAEEVHPRSGLPLVTVTVDTGEESYDFRSELAETPEAQARGLMFRTQLGDFEGMLFPSQTAQARSFWMKNTPLELDIIFIGPDGRIANIERGVPYSTDSVRSKGPAEVVFEIAGGRAAELGIEPGDAVEWSR